MPTQPIFDEKKLFSECTFFKQVEIECKLNTPTEIKSILSVTGTAHPVGEEIIEGELKFSARSIFNVVYENVEGVIEKTECGVEFFDKIEVSLEDKTIKRACYTVGSSEVKLINGNYSVYAVVDCAFVCANEKAIKLLVDGEDLIFDKEEISFKREVGCARSTLEVDEEFIVDYTVKDVLSHSSCVSINEAQSGLGVIIIDGNVFLSFTALQNGEKSGIVKEIKTIPFRLELAISEASPEKQAFAWANVSRSAIKVVVDEEKSKSTIIASFDLDTSGCVIEDAIDTIIKDAYSPKNVVSVSKEKLCKEFVASQFSLTERVTGVTDFEPEENSEVIAVIGERTEGVSLSQDGKSIIGAVSATVIARRPDGSLYSRRANLTFSTPFLQKEGVEYSICSAIESFSFRVRASVEFEAVIRFFITEKNFVEYSVIDAVNVGDTKEENTSAISIYVARGNDTLWDVCKELGMTAEIVLEHNPGVEFPLSGSERIIVYRRL